MVMPGFVCCSDEMDSSCDLVGIDVPKSREYEIKREEPIMSKPIRIAVDLAKNVYQIAISTRPGKITGSRRLSRDQVLHFFATQPKARVFMEACGTAHYWGRKIQSLGHDVILLPPHHVRPYVRGNKTDTTDARGIMDAGGNEDIHPVPIKTVDQQQMTALHRMRAGWMKGRVKRLNSLRGHLREFGIFIPVGAHNVVPKTWEALEDADSGVPDGLRPVLAEACQEIRDIDARIKIATKQIEAIAKQTPVVALLMTIPGVGLLTATALVAFLGDIRRFKSGRHLASYLGLTPREYSSGLKRYLGRISKRGDGYLRTLLIHGARSTLTHAHRRVPDHFRDWAHQLEARVTHNKAAVGVANKMARMIWAVWSKHDEYSSPTVTAH